VPAIGKRLMETAYVAAYFIGNLLSLKNPLRKIKEFKAKRGMNWFIDVVDWLGGYPYEAATTEEIFVFIKKNFPDFELINLKSTNTLGNNHFLFKRKNS
jgi:2-polyprenyl-6-hydroxyphenyl methylase/3-demethylubiquinone-9 3-methyltransferase